MKCRIWDKIIFCFSNCFPNVAEAYKAKMINCNSGELIGYQMWLLMQNKCAVLNTKQQSL